MLAKTAWDKAAKYAAKIAKTTDGTQVRFLIQMRNHWIEKANHLAALEERTTKRQRARVQQASVSRSASPKSSSNFTTSPISQRRSETPAAIAGVAPSCETPRLPPGVSHWAGTVTA
jgi:hypothetical protein